MVHSVLLNTELSPGVHLLRITREGLVFQAGNHVTVGVASAREAREYSLASGTGDPWLEILVRRVSEGKVSPKLCKLKPGEKVEIGGPCGYFFPESSKPVQFYIGTGTGIAPYRSFKRSSLYKDQGTVVHGVRNLGETGWFKEWDWSQYLPCVSSEVGGKFHGRVTTWLRSAFTPGWIHGAGFWLCGNFSMIQDAWEFLTQKGVPESDIHTEVYF